MKKIFFALLAMIWFGSASAQTKKPSQTNARKEVRQKSKPKAKTAKAGQSDPMETGSGMVIDKKDKPKLDERPVPVQSPVRPSDDPKK